MGVTKLKTSMGSCILRGFKVSSDGASNQARWICLTCRVSLWCCQLNWVLNMRQHHNTGWQWSFGARKRHLSSFGCHFYSICIFSYPYFLHSILESFEKESVRGISAQYVSSCLCLHVSRKSECLLVNSEGFTSSVHWFNLQWRWLKWEKLTSAKICIYKGLIEAKSSIFCILTPCELCIVNSEHCEPNFLLWQHLHLLHIL